MKISIIIPCYNEENTIKFIIEKVLKFNLYEKEILVIDDCSTDRSGEIIKKLALAVFIYYSTMWFMKYWKWLWLASLVVFVVYFVKEYLESGFDSVLFASGIAILVSGVGFLKKK